MSLLDGIETSEEIATETDATSKFEVLPTSLQNLTIQHVYMQKAKTGALMVTMEATTEDGVGVKDVQCIRSGDAKKNRNYYMVKDRKTKQETGEKAYLPGYNNINSLHELITGHGISKAVTAQVTVDIYDFAAKEMVATEVEAFTELSGKNISAGIFQVKVDKTTLNDASGKYEPTGEYREQNEINKYFDYENKLTLQEQKNGVQGKKFVETWHKKYNGKLIDKTDKNFKAQTGTPATGNTADVVNLFG